MNRCHKFACSLLFVAGIVEWTGAPVSAQPRETDRLVTEQLESFQRTVEKMIADQSRLDQSQKMQAADIEELQQRLPGYNGLFSEYSFKALSGRLDRAVLVSVLGELERTPNVTDPRQEFVRIIVDRLCKVERDNCQLRARIIQYEQQERDRQVNALAGSGSTERYGVNKPTLADELADVVPPPPATTYYLHRPSVCCRNRLCANAVLIAHDADGMYHNGFVEHGDIYLDCSNRQVLVRNMQQLSSPAPATRSVLIQR